MKHSFHSLTPVDAGEFPPEVDEGGELVDAVLLGVAVVVDLDERDVQRVRLVVDPLQPLQHALATGAPLRAIDWGVGRKRSVVIVQSMLTCY